MLMYLNVVNDLLVLHMGAYLRDVVLFPRNVYMDCRCGWFYMSESILQKPAKLLADEAPKKSCEKRARQTASTMRVPYDRLNLSLITKKIHWGSLQKQGKLK